MGRICVRLVCMLTAACMMATAGAAAETAVAWLGDTCASLSGGYAGLSAQMDWIVGHAEEESLRFVIHAGHIVCDWNDAKQWQDAANVLGKLDGKVAYSLLAGYDRIGHRMSDYAPFLDGYAKRRMAETDVLWYENGIANAQLVDTAQGDMLILSLSWTPAVCELRWADRILEQYADIPVILALNRYLNPGGQMGTIGAGIRNALLERHENVRLVLCAHGEGGVWTVEEEACASREIKRAVPVLGLGMAAASDAGKSLWILRLDEETDSLMLESRAIDGKSEEPVWTISTAEWF